MQCNLKLHTVHSMRHIPLTRLVAPAGLRKLLQLVHIWRTLRPLRTQTFDRDLVRKQHRRHTRKSAAPSADLVQQNAKCVHVAGLADVACRKKAAQKGSTSSEQQRVTSVQIRRAIESNQRVLSRAVNISSLASDMQRSHTALQSATDSPAAGIQTVQELLWAV